MFKCIVILSTIIFSYVAYKWNESVVRFKITKLGIHENLSAIVTGSTKSKIHPSQWINKTIVFHSKNLPQLITARIVSATHTRIIIDKPMYTFTMYEDDLSNYSTYIFT